MRIHKKKTILGISIFILLGVVFISTYGLYHTELSLTRLWNRISYSIENQLAAVLYTNEHITVPVTFKRQEHALTCEVAALRMALNYLNIPVTEEDLLEQLVFDTKEPISKDGIWGDPERGFVGVVDGSIVLGTGYGVYDKPIRDLALQYREDADILEKATLSTVLDEVRKGNPVIVWGLLSNRKPVTWKTKEGEEIVALPGEHARVVIGYAGDASHPSHIILMDPIYGKIRQGREKFLADWKKMNNRAVVVY